MIYSSHLFIGFSVLICFTLTLALYIFTKKDYLLMEKTDEAQVCLTRAKQTVWHDRLVTLVLQRALD